MRDANRELKIKIKLNKLDKEVLLSLANPKYRDMKNKYEHLKDICINNSDTKNRLTAHVIIGARDYTKIKTQESARVRQPGEPIPELTKLGWVIVSPGHENSVTNLMFLKTFVHDYENLYSLDVLS